MELPKCVGSDACTCEIPSVLLVFPMGSEWLVVLFIQQALANVNGIEQRLKGSYRGRNKAAGPPLSVDGQVDYLIQVWVCGGRGYQGIIE